MSDTFWIQFFGFLTLLVLGLLNLARTWLNGTKADDAKVEATAAKAAADDAKVVAAETKSAVDVAAVQAKAAHQEAQKGTKQNEQLLAQATQTGEAVEEVKKQTNGALSEALAKLTASQEELSAALTEVALLRAELKKGNP